MSKSEIISTLARQYRKINLALTDEEWEKQYFKLYGMQQAYRTVLSLEYFRECDNKAQKEAGF